MVKLGQNFLVDRNILDVIERLAELSADDVVLEIGGGQGILSTRLAARAGYVHVVELDRELEGGLRAALAPFTNAELHMGDALDIDLTSFSPPPDKIIANLPYGIAATVILRTIAELPRIRRWVVMVQREVGERFAAAPGTAAYGVPSVLAQLACEVRILRPVGRGVFRPVPNVDSVLLGLIRRDTPDAPDTTRRDAPDAPDATHRDAPDAPDTTPHDAVDAPEQPGLPRRGGPPATPAVTTLVHQAFAHRRKALAGSLALAPGAPPGIRERARQALAGMGLPADVRAERLSPEQFVELAGRLEPQ